MSDAAPTPGKRAGARRGARPPRQFDKVALLLGLGVLVLLAAWAVLVRVAISVGQDARHGSALDWVLLAAIGLAAAGCLFAALMVAVRVLRRLGIVGPSRSGGSRSKPTHAVSGRRAA